MATPLVDALVVLPIASSPFRVSAPRPVISPDISAMPWALSDTGPNVSIDTITPTVESKPIPVSAMKYRLLVRSPPPR